MSVFLLTLLALGFNLAVGKVADGPCDMNESNVGTVPEVFKIKLPSRIKIEMKM